MNMNLQHTLFYIDYTDTKNNWIFCGTYSNKEKVNDMIDFLIGEFNLNRDTFISIECKLNQIEFKRLKTSGNL